MDKLRLLIAVPHNSGTTYLANLLAHYIRPDVKYFHAADGFDGCDHVLSRYKLNHIKKRNFSFVAPLHTRASPSLVGMTKEYGINSIVMTRNLFDCIISLKERILRYDHKTDASSSLVFSHTLPIHKTMSDIEIEKYIIKFAIPWYISFYASWKSANIASTFVTYEDLVANPHDTLSNILKSINIEPIPHAIQFAIDESRKSDTRLNVGKIGRGKELSIAYRSEIADLIGMYPGIDFSDFFK